MKTLCCLVLLCWLGIFSTFSETLVLHSGKTVEGTIIRTNDGEYLLLSDFGANNFSQKSVKEIQRGEAASETVRNGRLPNFRAAVLSLSQQPWVSSIKQIPSTVIDNGVFKNVPYVSLRCGKDYEVNIYGDLKNPAGIEAGVCRTLLNDDQAKRDCLRFIAGLLNETADREIVQSLNQEKDSKEHNGYTFVITPPYAEDAYEGWWISVYSEGELNRSRASDEEMKQITVSKAEPLEADSSWTADDMKLARTPKPNTITIVTSSGETVTNAEVVRVVDSAYVVWRSPAGGMGMARLEALPEEIRARLGYDPTKAAAEYAAEERRKTTASTQIPTQPVQVLPQLSSTYDIPSYGSHSSRASGGGTVYVKGYHRKDGTYVSPHTRKSPRRH